MNRKPRRLWHAALLLTSVVAISAVAAAKVRHDGQWPASDKTVSLEAKGLTRSDAIQRLAQAAGWSIVLHAPPGDPVDLHVKEQPAAKVLDMLLADGDYVADRQGDLVSIARDTAAAPMPPAAAPAPPEIAASAAPPAPPASAAAEPDEERGDDRVITGGGLKIEEGETVHDVVMLGGSVDIFGKVTGDVVVTGGSVHLHDGARVNGDVTALGGSIDVDDGARVDGDVGVVGGSLHKAEGAKIGGDIKNVGNKGKKHVHVSVNKNGDKPSMISRVTEGTSLAQRLGSAITRTALLFVFGAIFLALTPDRMQKLQAEIVARPMRSFALGIVGLLVAAVLTVAMVVTIIGVPFAVIGAILAALGGYVGVCMVLSTVGGALIGHRTNNPYLHLALGCALMLVLGAIPYVGGVVTAAIVLVGVGSLVATRGAGLWPERAAAGGGHPYRT
jgi:hypothetical protein